MLTRDAYQLVELYCIHGEFLFRYRLGEKRLQGVFFVFVCRIRFKFWLEGKKNFIYRANHSLVVQRKINTFRIVLSVELWFGLDV